MARTEPLTIVLEGERPDSINQFYAGMNYYHRTRVVKRAKERLIAELLVMEVPRDPFRGPVSITMTAYFDRNQMDASNLMLKMYEDALKGWVLIDDTPKYVPMVTLISAVDKRRPRVEIEVVPLA